MAPFLAPAPPVLRSPEESLRTTEASLLRRVLRLDVPPWSLLLAILAAQAALSARLLRSDTAFGDEALYLWAGHLEWAHWLHGETSAVQVAFPTWFSGSPVIYPPLGAVADSLGGLLLARLLSLGFMLGATCCLYGVTARLLNRRAAIFAALIFVTTAPTQDLGAFATYDALALFLQTFGTWLGVAAAGGRFARCAVLLPVSGAVLVLADATKYATALWNPVAIAVIATAAWRSRGLRAGMLACAAVLGSWSVSLAAALHAGGNGYWRGILHTTVARWNSDAPVPAVLHESLTLIGPVLLLAMSGLVASIGADWATRFLCGATTVAVVLAPLNEARIHTTVSLYKHVDFGAWFGAIAAGYLMSRVSRIDTRRGWYAAVSAGIAVPVLLGSLGQATSWASYWPNTRGMVTALRHIVRPDGGQYLFEEFDVAYYYLHDQIYPGQVTGMFGFLYWDQARHAEIRGVPAFRLAIADRSFDLVEVDGQNIPASSTAAIEQTLARTRGYRLIFKQRWGPTSSTAPSHGVTEIWRLTTP